MKNFNGKGKRKAQSLVYELKNDLSSDKKDSGMYKEFLHELDKEMSKLRKKGDKTESLSIVRDMIANFRKNMDWDNEKFMVSRK